MSPTSPTPPPGTATDTFGIPPDVYERRKQILAVLCISLVLIVVAVSSLNVAIPTIQQELGASSTELQWIIDAYALVFAGFLLPAGALGDRFGRKGALQVGLVIFGICAVVASFSSSPAQLIASRAVMGLGAALVMPATLSIIQSSFPPHERAKAVATWAGLAGAGGAIGPLLSGLMLKWFWWGSVFFINLPLVAALLYLCWRIVPTSKDPHGHPLDPIGSVFSVIGLVALVFGIIEGPEWGWTSGGTLLAFGLAAVFLVAFVGWELRAEHPTLDPRLFRFRGFGMGSASITTIFFCMFGMFFIASQFLQYVKGYSPLHAGLATMPSALMMIVVSPRSPRITAAFGVRKTMRVGFVLAAIGLVGMGTLDAHSSYWHFLASLIVLASGIALVMPPSTTAIIGSLPLSKAGVGSAVNDVTREVGGAVGIAVLGSVLNSFYRSRFDLTDVQALIPPAMADRFAPAGHAASEGIGPAVHVARELRNATADHPALPAVADGITSAARDAFMSGTSAAFFVAAGVAAVFGLITSSRIPDEPATPGGAHTGGSHAGDAHPEGARP